MPKTPEEVDAMLVRLAENDLGSPYQVAYLFFIALLRHSDMAGDRMNETRTATTLKMFEQTLHPGCFCEDPKRPGAQKIRKHTRAAINRVVGNPLMARCYFEGATPLNEYTVDYQALTIRFQGGLGYKREEGAESDIAVFCEGQKPREGIPQVRIISVIFDKGKWWVKVPTKILISPIEPFYTGREGSDIPKPDDDDIDRENEYRRLKQLPLLETRAEKEAKAAAAKAAKENPLGM